MLLTTLWYVASGFQLVTAPVEGLTAPSAWRGWPARLSKAPPTYNALGPSASERMSGVSPLSSTLACGSHELTAALVRSIAARPARDRVPTWRNLPPR